MGKIERHAGMWRKGQSGNPKGATAGYKQRRTILREALMAHPKFKNVDPIDFMLEILSDPSYGLSNRKWAAVQVAPYLKSKMPIKVETSPPADDQAAQIRAALAAIDAATTGEMPTEQPPARPRVKLLEE